MSDIGMKDQPTVRRRILTWLTVLIVLGIYWWAFAGIEVNIAGLERGLPIAINIFEGLFQPEWSYGGTVLVKLFESVQMAFLGTALASILAVPFGFLAARNMTAQRIFSSIGKWSLNTIRTFPEIILAIIFMVGVGPGAFAGILALGVHSIGMLGKLYGEAIEALERGPVEALTATGANKLQTLWFAVLPQVLPEFASFAIYRFEINMRAAAILGIVGAGGIGSPLSFALMGHEWGRVGIILLGIIVIVSLIDFGSGWIRKRLV
jgi:phosphonate transport system permease protein